jgi:hypothetical protein
MQIYEKLIHDPSRCYLDDVESKKEKPMITIYKLYEPSTIRGLGSFYSFLPDLETVRKIIPDDFSLKQNTLINGVPCYQARVYVVESMSTELFMGLAEETQIRLSEEGREVQTFYFYRSQDV